MGEVVSRVSELTKGEAIIVTDVGQNQMYAARYYKFSHPNSLVHIRGYGNHGFRASVRYGSQNRETR